MLKSLPSYLLAKSLFLILTINSAGAQNIIWQKTIGGSGLDALGSAKPTSDSGFILAGSSNSLISGDKTDNNCDSTGLTGDFWIIKLDSMGNIQWQNAIGGDSIDGASDIIEITNEGYLIGGTSKSHMSCDKSENGCNPINNYGDYWIVKINSSGIIETENTISALYSDILKSIISTSDGGYVCAGSSTSNISCDKTDDNTFWHTGTSDFWIVKIDSIDNIQWQKTIGNGTWASDLSPHIINTLDGGFLCSGHSNAPYANPNYGVYDYWLIKLDQIGNLIWKKNYGGSGHESPCVVKQLSDGTFIVGGSSSSNISGLKTEDSFGASDYWILKLDSAGNIIWQKTIGGSGNDHLYSISPTIDGGFTCGGISNSPISGVKTTVNWGDYDNWIVRLDSLGNILWQRTIGGSGSDNLATISQMTNGNFFGGGTSNSNISGDKTENSKGGYDYWVFELDDRIISDFNIISGKVFFDYNQNNIKDSTDINLPYKVIKETNTNRFAFSQANGSYQLSVFDTGFFSVIPLNNPYYLTSVPNSHNDTFTGLNQIDSLNDFAIQQTIFINDLCITITPVGPFRSGFNATYNISYGNYGTTNQNATVIFYPDNVSYVSSSITPSLITNDSVVFNIGTILPFQTGNFTITVNVNLGLPIGTLVNSAVKIEPLAGDVNPGCNYSAWEVYTIGSFDPNDILVDKDTITTEELDGSPYLDYIIRFQNTGNDTAFTVKILNPIDTFKLDLMSFEFVSSSHPFNLNYIPWERNLEFKFENILLPDSNINEPESHGFVRYRIKPKTSLAVHDSVTNYAAIYFDYNLPVLTNTALTRIVYPPNYVELFTTVCDSFSSPSGNYVWTTSGLYFDTIPAGGTEIDSIYVINLTVGTSYSYYSASSCESYISPTGSYTWTSSGLYTDTLSNIAGCDSVVTVILTINYPSYSIEKIDACESYLSPSGNSLWTTTGTYNDTIINSEGCDSIIEIELTILNSSDSVINPVACNNYISPSGNYIWTSSGSYTDTLPNIYYCDSIITVNLTINESSSSYINVFECESYTSPSGNYTLNISGIYNDTIANSAGCDSIITIELAISNHSTSSINVNECNSYISPSGNNVWTASGIYNDTLINSGGCDSIITINLFINNSSTSAINPVECHNYTSPSGNYNWTTSGTYNDTITNSAGCDSIITINLTVNYNTTSNININECGSYISPSGNYIWTASGTYYDIINNNTGCDSIITINLTINSVNTSVTSNPPTLLANASNANYQWMFCDSMIIPGATTQIFTATSNGSYAVIVTQNGCTDTSACYSIFNVNVNEINSSNELIVFPNPTENSITIQFKSGSDFNGEIMILDYTGRKVYSSTEKNSESEFIKTIDVSEFADGLYYLQIRNEARVLRTKFVKQ